MLRELKALQVCNIEVETFFTDRYQQVDALKLTPGLQQVRYYQLELNDMIVSWGRGINSARINVNIDPDICVFTFLMPANPDQGLHIDGVQYPPGQAIGLNRSGLANYTVRTELNGMTFRIKREKLRQMGWNFDSIPKFEVDKQCIDQLLMACVQATLIAESGKTFCKGTWQEHLIGLLEPVLEQWVDSMVLDKGIALRNHQRIFMNGEALLLEQNMQRPMPVDELGSQLFTSRRTLFNVFDNWVGMGPIQYFNHIRLHRLRRDLFQQSAAGTSVGELSTKFGFKHPGRMSVAYKNQFGESPKATLLRSI